MWTVPMLSAAVMNRFSYSFFILFLSFGLLYLVHRPIVTIARGRADRSKDIVWALGISFLALILASILVLVYRRLWLVAFGAAELGFFFFTVRNFVDREQRSMANELTVVVSLTLSAPAAYYTITGHIGTEAVVLYWLNLLFFGSSVFYVKSRIELLKAKGVRKGSARGSLVASILYHVLLVASLLVTGMLGFFSLWVLVGFVPMLVQVVAGTISKETRLNFKRLGIGLVAQSLIFLAALTIFLKR